MPINILPSGWVEYSTTQEDGQVWRVAIAPGDTDTAEDLLTSEELAQVMAVWTPEVIEAWEESQAPDPGPPVYIPSINERIKASLMAQIEPTDERKLEAAWMNRLAGELSEDEIARMVRREQFSQAQADLILQDELNLFWRFSTLRYQDLLKVSMFGDSITKGSFNQPNASRVWPPEAAADIIARNNSRTTPTGSELWPTSSWALSGVTESGGVFTLTASGGQTNPRFASQAVGGISVLAGELYKISAEINTDSSVGKHLALRWFAKIPANTNAVGDQNFAGDDVATGGYLAVAGVVSADYLLSLNASASLLVMGGEIVSGTSGVGLVRNMSVKKLSKGVAVHNQGVDGDDTTEGLARIAEMTAWSPDVCIIAFGTNDIRGDHDLALYLANLTEMCDLCYDEGIYPILATMPPLASDQANYTDVPAWNQAVYELSQSLRVGFWDRYALLTLADIADGRHPTRAGYLALGADAAAQIMG